MDGYIHSTESFGTVDGPGIRFVVFLQGCPMRCLYCHNPDTWEYGKGNKINAQKIIDDYMKNREFYKNGGITVTGGEPLMQIDFITELFESAKEKNIHTCLDTSGIVYEENNIELKKKFDRLIKSCDLIMLDIKHIDSEKHKKLTGFSNENILTFAKYLNEKNIPVWIRVVVVHNITDNQEDLFKLGKFIGGLKNVKALDVLPYHTMGKKKYEELGIEYRLKDVPSTEKSEALVAREEIIRGIKSARNKKQEI